MFSTPALSSAFFSILAVASVLPRETKSTHGRACKYIPGDDDWPTTSVWQHLNESVHGGLIATAPIAQVCHTALYSEAECTIITNQWDVSDFMTNFPAEILNPWWQNESCVPYTPISTPCNLGNLASYSINVSNVDDIRAGLTFSEKNNVRLVIKNTGHDWLGKSTGKGALSLWTHNLNTQEIVQYNSSYYQGPALKTGAGVSSADAAIFAANQGYRVVVGDCETVGFAGGYTQGGGHSLLSGLYGLGADNVLEWEVIVPSGELLVASPTQNTDLYWALSGGGGGTYGIVVSMTTRLFDDGLMANAFFEFSVDTAGGVEEFWDAVAVFNEELQTIVDDNGVGAAYMLLNTSLTVFALMADGYTTGGLSTLLEPMVSALEKSGSGSITSSSLGMTLYQSEGYYDLYSATLAPLMAPQTENPVMGGRFVLRSNMAENSKAVIDSFRAATENGSYYLGMSALNTNSSASVAGPVASNAVMPAWRDTFLSIIVGQAWTWGEDWDQVKTLQADMLNRVMPTLEVATPGSGAYLNEANWQEPNWQDVFYGKNYDRLKQIKAKYDPNHVLYGLTSVGSDAWTQDTEGRLCRAERE